MLIDKFFNNGTEFRIFQDGNTYWVESLSLSGMYNITDGFSSFEDAEKFTEQK
jgi:hypothetical protein